jgi:hypothetical protein
VHKSFAKTKFSAIMAPFRAPSRKASGRCYRSDARGAGCRPTDAALIVHQAEQRGARELAKVQPERLLQNAPGLERRAVTIPMLSSRAETKSPLPPDR